jgi:uncharacterized RDD family membrane protein YckC
MRIYVQTESGTDGPYSLEQVQYLLDHGALTSDHTAWVEGTPDWVPLSEVKGIYVRPASESGSGLIREGNQKRPWVRYWARMIDMVLIWALVFIPFGLVFREAAQNRFVVYLLQFVVLSLWIPFEALLLSTVGYTPGKALLRVKVSNRDGGRLSFDQAVSRSSGVWWKGHGTGLIPFVTLITYLMAYRRLTIKGVTAWDQSGDFLVSHRKIGMVRVFAAIAILAFFVGLIVIQVMFK